MKHGIYIYICIYIDICIYIGVYIYINTYVYGYMKVIGLVDGKILPGNHGFLPSTIRVSPLISPCESLVEWIGFVHFGPFLG